MSHIVLEFYSSNKSKTTELIKSVNKTNPLNFDFSHNHQFYEYKVKKLLSDVAVGMMPSVTWTGLYDSTGGYLIVKNNGELLAYHLYNKNAFEDYLLNYTKLDTASSSRHKFGTIYQENENYYIKLNLQIRYTK